MPRLVAHTSLPLDAAQRVHELTTGALYEGARANEIAAEIMKTGEVTRSRANLIARTEVGRSATTLTQARAESVGSVGYIWRTARDYDVRQRHKELEGTFHAWNDPPVATDPGQRPIRAHAGSIFNCRCYAEPVLPGESAQSRANWFAQKEWASV